MHHVQSIPFLRILIPFVLGIFIYSTNDTFSIGLVLLLLVSLCALVFYRRLSIIQKSKQFWLNSLALHGLLFALGYFISYFHDVQNKENWYGHHITRETKLRAEITSQSKETKSTYKMNARVTKVYHGKKMTPTTGELMLYFNKNEAAKDLRIGDEVLFVNKVNLIKNKGNPGEFDYQSYYRNKGIYHQAFLKPTEWQKLSTRTTSFENPFLQVHVKVKKIITQYVQNPDSRGIALALITGYRDDIDQSIYTQYTETGLVHLLAISGLHMGILYGSVFWILGAFPFFRQRKKLLIILSLGAMWFFAFITTFPPSVQRASIMFTFLGIGQLLNRKVSSFNFLFASAFGLLLLQPGLLFNVGFQLSYAAVVGILLFFKPLRSWYLPKYKLTRSLWEITCLSLSAQIFTFPLALYYFHQFPVLFLFTNLVAIPLVMLIVYGEILLIIFSFIKPLASGLGKIVDTLINSLNQFIAFTASFKFVSIRNIYINQWQCFLLLIAMLALSAWLLGK